MRIMRLPVLLVVLLLIVMLGIVSLAVAAEDNRAGCDSCRMQINSLDKPFNMVGTWLFTRDDSPKNKDVDINTTGWRLIKTPGTWKKAYNDGEYFTVGWYRGVFEFNPSLIGQEAVILVDTYTGRINVYLDGMDIYRRPDNINIDRYYSNQPIPVRFKITQPRHHIAFKVQTPLMIGIYQLPFEMRAYDIHDTGIVLREFWGGEARMIAACVILFFGLFFLVVYFKTKYTLYLVASLASIILFPYLAAISDPLLKVYSPENLLFISITGLTSCFLAYVFSQYFYKFTPKINWVLGIIYALSTVGLLSNIFHFSMPVFQLSRMVNLVSDIVCGFAACYMFYKGIRQGKSSAGVLLAGMVLFLLTGLNDAFLAFGFIQSTQTLPFGMTMWTLSMLYVASNIFANTFVENKMLASKLKVTNDNLEDLVTERTDQLRQSEERYRTIIENSQDGYFEVDLAGNYIFFNESICEIHGYSKEEMMGINNRQLTDEDTAKKLSRAFNEVYKTEKPIKGFDWQIIRKDGTKRFIEASISLQKDSSAKTIGFRGITRDVTERKLTEEKIKYMATHDALTGLPNRLMFNQLINHAIQSAKRYQRQFGVLFIDLDRFKTVNDTMGHEAGDQLLEVIATRLKQNLRAVDIVARFGGDEFVILVEEVSDPSHVATVARKILTSIIKPINIMGQEYRITASIGICMYPKDAQDEQSLMKNADIAMYFAKEEGKNNYQFYSGNIQTKSLGRLSIETNLRCALERNELSLHYQAKVDFKTNVITGVEALLRWQNPYLGSVTPMQFIPIAEETGLIVSIGRWVMKTACEQNMAWQKQGLPPICMAVNLSPRQLTDANLIDDIRTVLDDSGMAPNLLELEITEGMVMHNPAQIIAVLVKIKSLGVRLTIDNFGTGYSSIDQIKHFPVDALKVDRSFVHNITQGAEDNATIKTIIALSKTLSLAVVAEGVETEDQMNFLKKNSCDEMQGYYFSKPIVPEQFADLLRKQISSPLK